MNVLLRSCAIPLLGVLVSLSHSVHAASTLEPAWVVLPFGSIPDDGVAPVESNEVVIPAGFNPEKVFTEYPWFFSTAGGGTNRSLAVNPLNAHVIVGNSSTSLKEMHVLNAEGVELHVLDTSTVLGGYHAINTVAVASDGAVFGTNLVLDAAANSLRIYRWADDAPETVPELIYVGNPGGDQPGAVPTYRWGDSFDVTGSGLSTRLVISPRVPVAGPSPVVVFTTTDTDPSDGLTFDPHFIPGVGQGGTIVFVAFGADQPGWDDPATAGTVENLNLMTLFTKAAGQPLRRTTIRPDTWTVVGSLTYNGQSPNPAAIPATVGPLGTQPSNNWLGGVNVVAGKDRLEFYDVSAASGTTLGVATGTTEMLTDQANTNVTGGVEFFTAGPGQTPGSNGIPLRSRVYFLSTNNSLNVYDIVPPEVIPPPSITTQPVNTTVIAGWSASFSSGVAGTPPLTYQWSVDTGAGFTPIPGANSASLVVPEVQVPAEGSPAAQYQVTVTDSFGTATSNPATLTVQPRIDTAVMTPAWKLPVNSPERLYLTTSDTQRGMAYNPATDHLLLVNRIPVEGLPNPSVVILSAATGEEIRSGGIVRTLQLQDPENSSNDVVTASGAPTHGLFALNAIDIANDGAIYASNLAVVGNTAQFKIYRWQNEAEGTPPTVAYGPGDLFNTDGTGDRAGEHIKVRGSGTSTQILVGARNEEKFAIFTTTDGLTFEPVVFSVPEARPVGSTTPSGSFFMCDFGAGDTIWAKTDGGKLLQIGFNLATAAAAIQQTLTTAVFPSGVGPIAYEPSLGLLGAIHPLENPNNLRLYNAALIGQPGGLLDLEFFTSDNVNGNRVGAVDFGNGRIYALDTNNGLVAMNLSYTPPAVPVAVLSNPVRNGGNYQFTLTGPEGTTWRIQRSTDLTTWAEDGTVTLDGGTTAEVVRPASELRTFFRARPQ